MALTLHENENKVFSPTFGGTFMARLEKLDAEGVPLPACATSAFSGTLSNVGKVVCCIDLGV